MLYVSRNIKNKDAIPEKFYIHNQDQSKILQTVIIPSDFKDVDPDRTYELDLSTSMARIKINKYREIHTGFHTDYVKKYFGVE